MREYREQGDRRHDEAAYNWRGYWGSTDELLADIYDISVFDIVFDVEVGLYVGAQDSFWSYVENAYAGKNESANA